jgi:hypothetical protein
MGGKMARRNADPFVGYPPQQNYTAAGNKRVTSRLRFESGLIEHPSNREVHGTHYHSIFVEGFVLDEIDKLAPASQHGAIPKEWKRLAQESQREYEREREDANDHTNNNVPYKDFWDTPLADDFWRTLVADRSSTGGNTARYYPRLLKYAYAQTTGSSTRNDTLDTQKIIDYGRCQPAGDVLRRIQSVIWNRKFTRTKRRLFGLVPDEAEPNDIVCILYGCSVPVVLRKYHKSPENMESEMRQQKEKRDRVDQAKVVRFLENQFIRRKLEGEIEKLKRVMKEKSMDASQLPGTPNSKKRKRPASSPKTPTPSKSHSSKKKKKYDHFGSAEFPKVKKDRGESYRPHPHPLQPNFDRFEDTFHDSIHSDPWTFYQLIGECYVHGMMNGEAISVHSNERLRKELFEIR